MRDTSQLESPLMWRLSKEGLWIALGQAIAVVGSVVGVRLLTEFLSPSAYGELALAMTLVNLTIQTFLAPLGNAVTRFYAPAQEKGELRGYLQSVRRTLLSTIGAILLIALLICAGLLMVGQGQWVMLAMAALAFGLLSGSYSILNGIHNAARKRVVVAFYFGIAPWGRLLCAVLLIVLLTPTGLAVMAGYGVATALLLVFQYVHIRGLTRMISHPVGGMTDWKPQIVRFAWPLSVLGLFAWAQASSGRWALELFSDRADVGLYAVLFQLGSYPIVLATSMVMQFVAPIFYGLAGDASDLRRSGRARKFGGMLTTFSLGMTGSAFVLTLLFHPQIFQTLVAREYATVSYLLPWVVLSAGLVASGQTIALSLMTQLNTRVMLLASIATGCLGVLLSLAGAYEYGITGVVIAGMLFSVPYLCWMAALSRKYQVSEGI